MQLLRIQDSDNLLILKATKTLPQNLEITTALSHQTSLQSLINRESVKTYSFVLLLISLEGLSHKKNVTNLFKKV